RAATRMAWPGAKLGRRFATDSGLTTAAISLLNITVSMPARFIAYQRKPNPSSKTHVAKKSAAGLVLAMVISMANKIANVVTMIVNSRQFNFSRLLKQLEPRLTVIAPTTPMA